jgi:hypothetical protein
MRERPVLKEIAAEFATEELKEFLEADTFPAKADPAFREQLRRRLWALVRSRQATPESDGADEGS